MLVQIECPLLEMLGARNASGCVYVLDLDNMCISIMRNLGDRSQT